MRLTASACVAGVVLLCSGSTSAQQGNVGLTIGGAARGYDRSIEEPAFHLGMRGDVLFARSAASDFGVGPYAELFTHAFDELQVGHGVSLLVPIVDTFPLIFSAGTYGRIGQDEFGFEPGFAGAIFVGTRGHNFSEHYDIAAGLLAQARVGLGASDEIAVVIAAHLDIAFLGLPIVYIIDATRGGSEETDEVVPEKTASPEGVTHRTAR